MKTERGEATRRRLLEAAAEVFSEHGYAGATTKQIARRAGVAEGTIYRHFSDKRELFQAVFADQSYLGSVEFWRLPELVGRHTVRENLKRFIRILEDVERTIAPFQAAVVSDAELMHALATPVGEGASPSGPQERLAPLVRYLEAEQRQGRIRSDVDPQLAAFAVFAIPFTAVAMSRLARRDGRQVAQIDIMKTLDVVLEGLLIPEDS